MKISKLFIGNQWFKKDMDLPLVYIGFNISSMLSASRHVAPCMLLWCERQTQKCPFSGALTKTYYFLHKNHFFKSGVL